MKYEDHELDKEFLERHKSAELEKKLYAEMRNKVERSRKAKRTITLFVSAVIFAALGLYVGSGSETKLVMYFIAGASITVAFLSYLTPVQSASIGAEESISNRKLWAELDYLRVRNSEFEKQNIEIRQKYNDIIEKLQNGSAGDLFSAKDKDEILNRIRIKIEANAVENYQSDIVSMVEERLKIKNYEDLFFKSVNRLELEIQNLGRRGNVNLVLGIFTTISGLGFLVYSVFNAPPTNSIMELLSHFVPRISLVLVVEIFAYFFLKLYKQSLSEIKYFQNEITNIECKYLGCRFSNEFNSAEIQLKIVESLLSTERNFILQKGQSTIDLELQKLELKLNSGILKSALSTIEKQKS